MSDAKQNGGTAKDITHENSQKCGTTLFADNHEYSINHIDEYVKSSPRIQKYWVTFYAVSFTITHTITHLASICPAVERMANKIIDRWNAVRSLYNYWLKETKINEGRIGEMCWIRVENDVSLFKFRCSYSKLITGKPSNKGLKLSLHLKCTFI